MEGGIRGTNRGTLTLAKYLVAWAWTASLPSQQVSLGVNSLGAFP